MKNNNTLTPTIYVACLASYNNGHLHGRWIDACQDMDAIYDDINNMLAESPVENAEEWAIHDMADFGPLSLGEHECITSICHKARFIEDYGELGATVLEYTCGNIEEASRLLRDAYEGAFESEREFAEELLDALADGHIPEQLQWYMDFDLFARDLFTSDYFSLQHQGQTHVFSSV